MFLVSYMSWEVYFKTFYVWINFIVVTDPYSSPVLLSSPSVMVSYPLRKPLLFILQVTEIVTCYNYK